MKNLKLPKLQKNSRLQKNRKVPQVSMQNFLIIQTAFIGDVVLTTPMIQLFVKKFPDARLSIVVREDIRPLLRQLPELAEIFGIRKGNSLRSLISFFRIVRTIRRKKFDVLMCPHKSFRSALIAIFSSIPLRCGYADGALANFAWHRLVPFNRGEHETVRLIHFMQRSLKLSVTKPVHRDLIPHLHASSVSAQRSYLYDLLQYVDAKRPIALAPSSIWATKRWMSWHFAFLCDSLIQKYKKEIILLGGDSDEPVIQRFLQFVRIFLPDRLSWIKNHCGKIRIEELYQVLQKCSWLIGNDSAPAHIACAADIPVISVFGPTHPRFGFAPMGRRARVSQKNLECRPCCSHGQARCPKLHFRCMKEIPRQQIMADLEKLL